MGIATFAGLSLTPGSTLPESFVEVAAKDLPGNTSWAVTATVTTRIFGQIVGNDTIRDLHCELRESGAFMGGASDRRVIPSDDSVIRSLTVTGGAFIRPGGGRVSLMCRGQGGLDNVMGALIMLVQVDGFS